MKRLGFFLFLMPLLVVLPACSTIKSWFPDKERDYQFRTEIAPLQIPDDLKTKSLPILPAPRSPQQIASNAVLAANNDSKNSQDSNTTVTRKNGSSVVNANQAQSQASNATSSSVSSLLVDQGMEQAWRMVGKSLTQKKIEIVDRNLEQGHFHIRYGSSENNAIYTSVWDEFKFLFDDDLNSAQEYRVKLTEISAVSTEVIVQDIHGKALSNTLANQILKLITDGINGNTATDVNQENKQ